MPIQNVDQSQIIPSPLLVLHSRKPDNMTACPTVRAGLLVRPASHIDRTQPAFLLYLATDFHSRIAYTSYALRAGATPRAKMILTKHSEVPPNFQVQY